MIKLVPNRLFKIHVVILSIKAYAEYNFEHELILKCIVFVNCITFVLEREGVFM